MAGNKKRRPAGQNPRTNTQSSTSTRRQASQSTSSFIRISLPSSHHWHGSAQQSSVQPHPEQANEIPEDSSSITTGLPAKQRAYLRAIAAVFWLTPRIAEPAEAIRDRPRGARTPIEVKPSTKNSQRKKANFDDLILQEMNRRVHFLSIEDFFDKFAPGGSGAQSQRAAQVGKDAAEKILEVDLETKMYPILVRDHVFACHQGCANLIPAPVVCCVRTGPRRDKAHRCRHSRRQRGW